MHLKVASNLFEEISNPMCFLFSCWSYVGYLGNEGQDYSPQKLSLDNGCYWSKNVSLYFINY